MNASDSRMCRYFCIGFINFMLKGKSLLEYTNLVSPNNYTIATIHIIFFVTLFHNTSSSK